MENERETMRPEFIAAIESERAPLDIDFDDALKLYQEDDSFRERVDEYMSALLEAPPWYFEGKR